MSVRTTPIPIDVRRAVLAVLIRAQGGPLPIAEIVRRTKHESGLDLATLPGVQPEQRVSDILRHQARSGRAKAVGRGVYLLDTSAFSESTRWRCLHWEHIAGKRGPYSRYIRRYRGEP